MASVGVRMKQPIRKILALFAVLAILAYVAWQVTENLTEQIKTVDAMEITVEEKLSLRGWFIRQQTLVESESGGTAEYLLQDGEKVARGQRLAVFFSDGEAQQAYDQARTVEDRLEALEYAYGMITGGADSLKMDQLIAEDLIRLGEDLSAGETRGVGARYAALQQLVASRGSSGGDQESFDLRIAALREELEDCKRRYTSGSSYVKASASGYFASGTDGYETVLTTDRLDTLTPAELNGLQRESAPEAIGSIVTGYRWYYAAVLTREQAAALQNRSTVELYFPQLSQTLVTMKLYRLQVYEDGQAILILESDEMLPDYLTSREQDVDLLMATYTGLKVPSQALRQLEGKWGVYVLEGSAASFKPIQWVYQTNSYYLVPCAKNAKSGLYRYDRMIVQGKNLADDKLLR